jgi:putative component of toxin-antitoxin plasmid stabilization module
MSKFVLKEYNNVIGKIKFFKIIEDKICYWDDFCREIQKDANLEDQLITVISRMNDIANLRMLPKEKFRDITPKKQTIKEYEIKTKDLRVYFIKDELGNLVLIGGKKNSQPEDIKRFRAIKKAYLNSTSK